MRYIKLFLFFALLTTTQTFAADDIESLKAEIKQLKADSEKKEVDALKQEILELKLKRIEDKLDTSEKRLDDKLQIKSEILNNKIESSAKDSASSTVINNNAKSEPNSQVVVVANQNQRHWSLNIASAGSNLNSSYTSSGYYSSENALYMSGISAGISYTKNRFFGELIGTSISGKIEEYVNSYSYYSWYSSYSLQTTEASMKSVDLRLGYQLGGDIFKFEPYVGLGKGSLTFNGTSNSFTQFAPGAKLSLGSKQVRVFLDVTMPKDISSKQDNQVKLNTVAKIGLSFAF